MEIRFQIDKDRFTLGDMMMLEDAQEGKRQANALAMLFARFMVDENGQPLDEAQALAVVKKLNTPQVNETMKRFMEVANSAAIPPEKSAS